MKAWFLDQAEFTLVDTAILETQLMKRGYVLEITRKSSFSF